MEDNRQYHVFRKTAGRPEHEGHKIKATLYVKYLLRKFRKFLVDGYRHSYQQEICLNLEQYFTTHHYQFPIELFKENEEIIRYVAKISNQTSHNIYPTTLNQN